MTILTLECYYERCRLYILNLYDYNLNCGIRIRASIHWWVLWFCTIIRNSSVVALILHMFIFKCMHCFDSSIPIFPFPIFNNLLSCNKCSANASCYNCTQVLVFGIVFCTCGHLTRLVQVECPQLWIHCTQAMY